MHQHLQCTMPSLAMRMHLISCISAFPISIFSTEKTALNALYTLYARSSVPLSVCVCVTRPRDTLCMYVCARMISRHFAGRFKGPTKI